MSVTNVNELNAKLKEIRKAQNILHVFSGTS